MSEIQNGVGTSEYAGAIVVDHTPTDDDKTGTKALIVQYDTSDIVLDNGVTCLYRATAKYVEI